MNIIGISAFFHDASCCLIKNGKLISAAAEERFSRIKHDPSIPRVAFQYCLEEGGINITELDCIAYYEIPELKLERQLSMGIFNTPRFCVENMYHLDPNKPLDSIRDVLGFNGKVLKFSHHLSHAASAFYYSGFPESAILTVDGVGEWATTTYGRAIDSSIDLFEEVHYPHSLGLLYSAVTSYLGFSVNYGEYKVMGLAPYGELKYSHKFNQIIKIREKGQYELDSEYFDFTNSKQMFTDKFVSLFGEIPRKRKSEITQFHKDVARSLQHTLEEILLKKIRYLHQQNPSDNLCLAGGVALNCVANGRIRREGPFKNIFIQPAANDAGGALGAAALAHVAITNKRPDQERLHHVYFGPSSSEKKIQSVLSATGIDAIDYHNKEDILLTDIVEQLTSGAVVGWYKGRMEFGPRALGARSIIADPRRKEMRDRINSLVKKRESFRPFAPVVLESHAHEHFDIYQPSPFMLETCKVISSLDLPAITHINGSARVQTITCNENPLFAALLEEFYKDTGCPILLNTSFNMSDEPIVNTPEDALICFARSKMDVLVIENYVVYKESLSDIWRDKLVRHYYRKSLLRRAPVSHDVYTFF